MSATEFPSIEELVPHRGESLLLDYVVAHDGKTTTAHVTVASHRRWQKSDGSVPSWLAVEYMAQCAAAHEGLLARAENRTLPLGFLISVRALRLARKGFHRDDRLHVRTRRVGGRPGLGALSHECELYAVAGDVEPEVVAEGRLSISIPRSAARPGSQTDSRSDSQPDSRPDSQPDSRPDSQPSSGLSSRDGEPGN